METLYYGTLDFAVTEFRERKAIDDIKMVMTAFDCVIPDNAGIYCSSDVTTGRQLYEILRHHGARSKEELRQQLGSDRYQEIKTELIRRNIARGIEFTEGLRRRGLVNLINPGPFIATEFDQQHYLYLWEWIIIKKVYEIRFNENWAYSNGCTLEYAIAAKKGIPRLDHLGHPITLPQAIQATEVALADLKHDEIRADKLEQHLALLKELQA